ncbi:hypothetical protein RQP46_007250 [Phenoliferia psychrophenolica]
MPRDHYVVLELTASCTLEDIRSAFKRLALIRHPDKGGSDLAFQELNLAHEVLTNPLKRAEYDRERAFSARSAPTPPPHHPGRADGAKQGQGKKGKKNAKGRNQQQHKSAQSTPNSDDEDAAGRAEILMNDAFELYCGAAYRQGPYKQQRPRNNGPSSKGTPRLVEIQATLEEMSTGKPVLLNIERPKLCVSCHGKIGSIVTFMFNSRIKLYLTFSECFSGFTRTIPNLHNSRSLLISFPPPNYTAAILIVPYFSSPIRITGAGMPLASHTGVRGDLLMEPRLSLEAFAQVAGVFLGLAVVKAVVRGFRESVLSVANLVT